MNDKMSVDKRTSGFDSLFRFYGSQITAHSNYLVAWSFAVAVYVYRLVDRLEKAQFLWYDLGLSLLLTFLGLYLIGRLVYYTELSNIVQNFMGLSHAYSILDSTYNDLIQREEERYVGIAEVISNTLRCRIMFGYLRRVEHENYKELCKGYPINQLRSVLIMVSNVLSSPYRQLLKELTV